MYKRHPQMGNVRELYIRVAKISKYTVSVKMAALWGSLNLLSFIHFVFTCAAIWPHLKYSRIRLRNAKPAQSLRRTSSKRNSRNKNRSNNKMAAPEAPVHPIRNRLCYISPFTKRTKVVPKVFQECECCLEGLINLAFGLQRQMLPRLNGHFMNVLVWFWT